MEESGKKIFTLHDTQKMVASDTHRFRVINAGRRWGKSTLVAWEMFAIAASCENARIPYYAPTRDDARDIMWKALKDICEPLIIGEPNESRLEINIRNRFGGSSLIILYGWEAVQERGKGVGVRNNHIFLDEVSKFKNFLFGWQEILRPTLIDLKGGATFISTPNGFNHFYDLSLMEGQDPDYKYFHFTSMDNPHLPPEELEKMKIEMTDDRFAQEVLGEFRKKEGLVYKDFSRARHVLDKLPENFETLYTLGGVDWGHTHPCAVITIKKDYSGNYFITDEYYKTGRTESEIVDKVVSLCYNKVFPDPENASGIESLRRAGVNIREVNKSRGSVVSGISKVQELLRQGRVRVLSHCVNTIQEFESYSYPDDKGKIADENPLKENDDAMDAIRYVLMSDEDSMNTNGPKIHYGNGKSFINKINWGKFKN
jgi:PBSX family phage terminase large subunit